MKRLPFRSILLLLAGFSLLQYLSTGAVTWPADVLHRAATTLGDYAHRPEAGWRRATDTLEKAGAARERRPVPAFDLRGRVVRIADGDTVSLLDKTNTQHKVRLYGIDTPEWDQPHGKAARSALASLVADKTVGVVVIETDSYGRTVGTLFCEGANINEAMVAGGHAWWYRHYAPHNRLLAASEQQARAEARGLWAATRPIPPWDWRRGRR